MLLAFVHRIYFNIAKQILSTFHSIFIFHMSIFIFHVNVIPHKLVYIDTKCKLQLVSCNTRNIMPTILAYNSLPSSFDPTKNPVYYNLHTKELIVCLRKSIFKFEWSIDLHTYTHVYVLMLSSCNIFHIAKYLATTR